MKTILKITADEDGRVEVHIDAKETMDPLTLVGLLEQIKLDLFREHMPLTREKVTDMVGKTYDA
jgi:hypothetical protein